MKKITLSAISLAVTLACASGAQAASVQMDSFVSSNPGTVAIQYNSGSTHLSESASAGAFNGQFSNGKTGSFISYCVDIFQTFSWHSPFSTAESTTTAQFGTAKANAISQLYSLGYATSLTNATYSAAFQLALWEIVNDNDFSLNTGTFKATGTNSSILNQASYLLANLGAGGPKYDFTVYTSSTKQDQLVATPSPVPLPTALPLMASALGLLGFNLRRRKN